MSDAPLIVDLARIALAVVAGGTLAQLAVLMVADRKRPADRHRTPAQAALLLSMVLVATDASMHVGEPFQPLLFVMRSTVVVATTWYVLDRQGHLRRRR